MRRVTLIAPKLIAGGFLLAVGLFWSSAGVVVAAATVDYATAGQVDQWLRHPVYGDPSFDSFERLTANPIHRGNPPFEWPVNGFFFPDPRSGNWYVFVGDYARGYGLPPSRCLLYRSLDHGVHWTALGPVLQGDPHMFDRGGHTPDVSIVYDRGRYHMVYDWGEPNFGVEGGLAYAWSVKPEGPWHRAPQPITRNSTLPPLLGKYQRTYAGTLIHRAHDWLILAMMDHAPSSWALFAMTAKEPGGPYSPRRLVRHVESANFHPPLMEFFPAFTADGFVYAPATSVALNRNFNALFRAPLEQADAPEAWSLFQYGSLWHAQDVEAEHFGLWGQTFSGAVTRNGVLWAMFPSRDQMGQGTINLAHRLWKQPYQRRGFVLSGHSGPSLTLLRRAYPAQFTLEAQFRLRGSASVLLDFDAPLSPNVPSSDATLSPLSATRQIALRLAPLGWSLVRVDAAAHAEILAAGAGVEKLDRTLRVQRHTAQTEIILDGRLVWTGSLAGWEPQAPTGVVGLRVEHDSHLAVERFQILGQSVPAHMVFLHTEAILGAGASGKDWKESNDGAFRFGIGAISTQEHSRAKWNLIGSNLKVWSPRGPGFGQMTVRIDGAPAQVIELHADKAAASTPVWATNGLADTGHAVVVEALNGTVALDCLEISSGPAARR